MEKRSIMRYFMTKSRTYHLYCKQRNRKVFLKNISINLQTHVYTCIVFICVGIHFFSTLPRTSFLYLVEMGLPVHRCRFRFDNILKKLFFDKRDVISKDLLTIVKILHMLSSVTGCFSQ